MDKLSTQVLGLVALATTVACAAFSIPAGAGPSHLAERTAMHRASRLSNVKVTAVNERARTFTVVVVLSAADLRKLPADGTSVDVTYTEAPGGEPLSERAWAWRRSRN